MEGFEGKFIMGFIGSWEVEGLMGRLGLIFFFF